MLRTFWRLSGCAAKPYREATGNPVEEGAERLRSSTDCDPEGRQRCDVLRPMRDVWESVAAHSPDHGSTGSRDEAEQSHSACVHREATGRDRTDGHGSMMMQATPQQSLYTECSTCSTTSGLSLDGCDVRLADQGGLRGCRREHGSHWGRRDTVPRKVQGQLKGVDQEACLQLIYDPWTRAEAESGIGRTSDGVFQHS